MNNHIIRVLIGVVLCVFMTQNIDAQRFVGSVVAGCNFAQIEGDGVHGFYKPGANAGLGLTIALNKKESWQLSVELLYTQKGSVKHCSPGYFDTAFYGPAMFTDVDRNVPFDPKTKCNISLDYVQVPVLIHYEERYSGCTFGLGFAWSRLVRAHEIYNGFTRTTTVRSGTYSKNDWSVIADVNIRLYKNLNLNFRWEYSMVPIRTMEYVFLLNDGSTVTEVQKMHNHMLSARLIYYINQKFYKNTRVNKYGQVMGTKWLREIPDYND
ncbi:MAG: outer membrane beta-barrel protein [Bacteroidales bacterium]|nr:outer membrane beta-barrel protein [Bacteroidales bacterium]